MSSQEYNCKIYQMNASSANAKAIFRSYESVIKNNQLDKIRADNYSLIYERTVTAESTPEDTLEKLFRNLQSVKPVDYKGHSLSVSDVIILDNNAYYVDSVGFKKLDNFITERN